MRARAWAGLGALAAAGLAAGEARATYSIAATDAKSRQVGGAVTSCVGTAIPDLGVVFGGVPGKGVVHAQAQLDPMARGKMRAIMMLMMDAAPADIIKTISDPSFDSSAAVRQYGIADLKGRAAGFTGSMARSYKADKQGMSGTFTYSVQGNILTSGKVLDQAAAAFESGGGCDLAERLMLALEAGGKGGEGDSRCTVKSPSTPSDSAFIEVDAEKETPGSYLKLSVTNTRPESPLVLLRGKLDEWRKTHPCPPPPDAGAPDGGGADGGGAGDSPKDGGAGDSGGNPGGDAAGSPDDTCDCRLGAASCAPGRPRALAAVVAVGLGCSIARCRFRRRPRRPPSS